MDGMLIPWIRANHGPFSRGEAVNWARRLRKIGFSPVELHYDEKHNQHYLLANWPYTMTDWPVDLVDWLEKYVELDGFFYEPMTEVIGIGCNAAARKALRLFGAARLGMGSRPLPKIPARTKSVVLVPAEHVHDFS